MLSRNRGKITLSSLKAKISYIYYVIITPTTPKTENSENSITWKIGFETQSMDESRCFSLNNNLLNLVG